MKDKFILESWSKLGWKNPFWELLNLNDSAAKLITRYCSQRENLLQEALTSLRTEEEAKGFCKSKFIEWKVTKTQSKDHHQSSKTLIATVAAITKRVCEKFNETADTDPTRRCVWCIDNRLHVTARNLDGAIPSLRDPYVVWKIKEYWGKTSGGSKMSDAVYECHLVGREIREFEEKSKHKISHIVFLDGKEQIKLFMDRGIFNFKP
jgi:hypothetical protein